MTVQIVLKIKPFTVNKAAMTFKANGTAHLITRGQAKVTRDPLANYPLLITLVPLTEIDEDQDQYLSAIHEGRKGITVLNAGNLITTNASGDWTFPDTSFAQWVDGTTGTLDPLTHAHLVVRAFPHTEFYARKTRSII